MSLLPRVKLISFYLRLGLASVFLYAAVSSLLAPRLWIGFVPDILAKVGAAETFLPLFSLFEFALALWLLSGRYARCAATAAAATLGLIIAFNLLALDIVFRDVAILFMTLALIETSRDGKT